MAQISQKGSVLTVTLAADEVTAFAAVEADPVVIITTAVAQVMNRSLNLQFQTASDQLRDGILKGAISVTDAQSAIQPLLTKIAKAAV